MGEKEKNKDKTASNRLFGISLGYIALAILAVPLSCASVIWLVVAYDDFQMHQCANEGEPFEWDGLVDYEALPINVPINEANLYKLIPLPYHPDAAIFPETHYNSPISHPEHDYFLSTNISGIAIYPRPMLIVCQPDGWASHILSYYVFNYRFSPDGEHFASGSNHDYLVVYDATTIELLGRLSIPRPTIVVPSWIYAFHPTEPLIAILVTDLGEIGTSRLHFWNYETQELFDSILIDDGFPGSFGFLAFNEDGSLLIARRAGATTSSFVWGIAPE